MVRRAVVSVLTLGLLLVSAPLVSAGASKQIVDPIDDANFVNDQGYEGAGGIAYFGDASGPMDLSEIADILDVRFSTQSRDLVVEIHVQSPPKSQAVSYQVATNPGLESEGRTFPCLWFQAHGGDGEELTATFTDYCVHGWTNDHQPAKVSVRPLDDGSGVISIRVVRALSPSLGAGEVITQPVAYAREVHRVGSARDYGPTLDSTKPGSDYRIGSGRG